MPGSPDALDNASRLKAKGMALMEKPEHLTVQSLSTALKQLLNHKRYFYLPLQWER